MAQLEGLAGMEPRKSHSYAAAKAEQGLTMGAGLGFLMKPQNSRIAHGAAQGFSTECQDWKLCHLGTDTVTITVPGLVTTVTHFHPFQADCEHVLKWAQ